MAKYCLDEANCEHETYSKEELDELIENKPNIFSGETEPDEDLGEDGDIYIKYS